MKEAHMSPVWETANQNMTDPASPQFLPPCPLLQQGQKRGYISLPFLSQRHCKTIVHSRHTYCKLRLVLHYE